MHDTAPPSLNRKEVMSTEEEELRLVHYVLSCHEHYPDDLGRYICPIPPHIDTHPSANVRIGERDNEAILGCFSHPGKQKAWTAAQLVAVFENMDVFKSTARVDDYRAQMQAAGWMGPTLIQHYQKQRLDANILRIRREMAEKEPIVEGGPLDQFLQSRPDLTAFGVTADYLRKTWDISDTHPDHPGEIYIPYFEDTGDQIIDTGCAKHRNPAPGSKPMSVGGSDFSSVLYGGWMDDGVGDVLLCEGESDTWAAHANLAQFTNRPYRVLGLPSGARGPTAYQMQYLQNRKVFIAFDNDDAGNAAALKWKEVLPRARRLQLPVGKDICSLGPDGFGACEVLDEPYALEMMDFLQEPDPEWMIDGMIIRGGGIGQIIGSSTAGKTFVALDLAFAVCSSDDWMGHKIRQNGPVVYACLENPAGFRKRVRAWVSRYLDTWGELPDYQLRVVRGHQVNLTKAESVAEFLDGIRSVEPAMVIIDTQAKATAGMDENSAQDTGIMITYIEAIAQELACPVILVHHSGHDDNNTNRQGGRGSSALFAAMDFVLHIRHNRKTDERTIHFTKLKDGEPIAVKAWKIEKEGNSAVIIQTARNNLTEAATTPPTMTVPEEELIRQIREGQNFTREGAQVVWRRNSSNGKGCSSDKADHLRKLAAAGPEG